MAEKGLEPRSPMKDVGWLVLFLIVLGVIWFAQGGPQRLTSTYPVLKYPEIAPSGSQPPDQEKKTSFWEEETKLISGTDSPYKGKVSLRTYGVRETDPQQEYLELRAVSKTEPILITGWTLKGRQGLDIAIGKGAYLVYSGQVNPQDYIYLEPDGEAIIATGQSPVGTNFRLNICTGYFNQSQDFIPSLPQECPRIPEEDVPLNYPDACFDFVKSLSRCRMPLNIPFETQFKIGNDCILFLSERANYNGCVNKHKADENFYKKEWRIYLGRNEELWRNRDVITLFDSEGKIIDSVSY